MRNNCKFSITRGISTIKLIMAEDIGFEPMQVLPWLQFSKLTL